MVHCESSYRERFKQRSGLREKDPWHFQGWQEVSLAEEAARDRMVGDEGGQRKLGGRNDGEEPGDQSTQGIAGQVEALAWNEREAKSRFAAGR